VLKTFGASNYFYSTKTITKNYLVMV